MNTTNSMADHPNLTALRVGLVSTTFYYTPLWIGIDTGVFAEAGLDLQLDLLGNRQPGPLLYDQSIDIAIAPPDGVLRDVDAGGTLRLLAGNSDRLSHCLITQPEIRSVEDMRGKRFGILSRTEGSFFHFQAMAAAHGLHFPGDYEVIETGGAPLRHQMLLDRRIDAGLQSFPWVYVAEEAGFNNLCDICDYLPEWQFNTVNADARWVEANQLLVQRFLVALQRATDLFYADRELTSTIAARRLNISLETSLRGWDYFARTRCITPDMRVNRQGLGLVHAALGRAGLLKGCRPYEPERYLWAPAAETKATG